jgi:hypothetical protein
MKLLQNKGWGVEEGLAVNDSHIGSKGENSSSIVYIRQERCFFFFFFYIANPARL